MANVSGGRWDQDQEKAGPARCLSRSLDFTSLAHRSQLSKSEDNQLFENLITGRKNTERYKEKEWSVNSDLIGNMYKN